MIEMLLSSNERIPRMASLSNVDMVGTRRQEGQNNVKSRCRVASRVTFPAREIIDHPYFPFAFVPELHRNNTHMNVLWDTGYSMCPRNCLPLSSEVRAPASVQSNPTLLHRPTETWVSSWRIGETHVEGRLHLGTKQRRSTSFSHLQCQIVDVHLQSGVSR
jgi:hypothetical protein